MSQAQLMELVKEPAFRINGDESSLDVSNMGAASGTANHGNAAAAGRAPSRSCIRDEDSLDQSMDSHFNYIQDVSAPQELDGLLPMLHATLTQVMV